MQFFFLMDGATCESLACRVASLKPWMRLWTERRGFVDQGIFSDRT